MLKTSRIRVLRDWFASIIALLAWIALFNSHSACAEPLTYDSLQKLIAQNHVQSIEQLLPLLPPEFRSQMVLVYKSGSLQQASLKEPRVLLYNRHFDSKGSGPVGLILSFSGNASAPNGNLLETAEFDPQEKIFKFRPIAFGTSSKAVACTQCHSGSLHPIWDTYPVWRGVYAGKHLGYLAKDENPKAPSRVQQFVRKLRLQSVQASRRVYPAIEEDGFQEFLKNKNAHPRYRFLEIRDPSLHALDEMNADFSRALAEANAQRILAEVTKLPDFPRYSKAFEAALGNSEGVFSLLPNRDKAQSEYRRLLSDTRSRLQSYHSRRDQGFSALTGREADVEEPADLRPHELERTAKLRLVVESYMNGSMKDWAMTRDAGTYAFAGPKGGISMLQTVWEEHHQEWTSQASCVAGAIKKSLD